MFDESRALKRRHLWVFVMLMVLVGLNLRPALSSLAPLLSRIQQETGLSALAIGALTTLTLVLLGIIGLCIAFALMAGRNRRLDISEEGVLITR
ncbi:hypothetical protein [Halomonas sp.]|jgi:cyanate permease|uniref:hypothetical protein n=1 Tax=Halomonas sp. TaxID=1486246 RepID=UPI0035646B14